MTQITLVLPFALPPPELAADLLRVLEAPALASLLTRTSARHPVPVDESARALPHEAWLADTLGLSSAGHAAFSTAAMHGFGLAASEGSWFILNPAHIDIARTHLSMRDLRSVALSEEHSRALFATAEAVVTDSGRTLVYGDADTWFLRADDWSGLSTATPDCTVGQNLTDWMPRGENAVEFRKLQNEIQMMWFEHPVNVEREAHGLASINSFWPWGLAQGSSTRTAPVRMVAFDAPAWLNAVAHKPTPAPGELFAKGAADTIVVCDLLSEAALAGNWANWLQQMKWLDDALFAPALAAVRAGHTGQLTLLLSHRSAQSAFHTSKLAHYAFWRRPTLNCLLP